MLRIMGAEDKPLPCQEIASRPITVVPGITGLIGLLADREPALVRRERDDGDRRAVNVSLTEAGQSLLVAIDAPMAQLHEQMLARLTGPELAELARLLAKDSGNAEWSAPACDARA